MTRWVTTYEVTVETEFRPTPRAEREMSDAMSEGAVVASLAHECGEVTVRVRGQEPFELPVLELDGVNPESPGF
jgi:hypothetical protein